MWDDWFFARLFSILATMIVAGRHTAAYISPASASTGIYWNVAEPMAEALLTISGSAMVKHNDDA